MNIHVKDLEQEAMLSSEHMSELRYFPTLLYKFELPFADQLNHQLLSSIYQEKEKDEKGIQRSNFRKLGGWHSHNNLHKEDNFKELRRHIESACQLLSENLQFHKAYKFDIGTMWSIINPPGSANRAHIHPGCHWSGVYYIQAPENAGDIEFTDPRTINIMHQMKFIPNKKRPKQCWTKVRFTPKAGTMIIFPSWLYHSVGINESEAAGDDGNRIIISFNISQNKIKKSQ